VTLPALAPGDVMVVRTGGGWAARLIRFSAALEDKPNLDNHVAVVHHTDAAGTPWAIEGRPGGVGWVDARRYDNPYLLTNTGQPKTTEQRERVCALTVGLLGTPYDWSGIVADAMAAVGAPLLWRTRAFGSAPPAHVVCSSLAAWAYRQAGLAEPGVATRAVTPADWADFILGREWAT
jgi:hypothetical protein